jgi:hypothetical protein
VFGLAYASRAKQSFDEQSLRELAIHAERKNKDLDVTGYLNFNRGIFFQFLEGDRHRVLDLMEQIARDDRHEILNIIHLDDLETRFFPDWRMRFVTNRELTTVRMEDILENVLVNMTTKIYGEEIVKRTVLRTIQKMAELRTRLPMPA